MYLFVFCGRRRDLIKVLYFDSSGFCLWLKRLEKDKFPWPKKLDSEVVSLTPSQFAWLLEGYDISTPIRPWGILPIIVLSTRSSVRVSHRNDVLKFVSLWFNAIFSSVLKFNVGSRRSMLLRTPSGVIIQLRTASFEKRIWAAICPTESPSSTYFRLRKSLLLYKGIA